MHSGAGVYSICHVASKARLVPEKRTFHRKTNLLGTSDMRFADLFRMKTEGFDEQNRFNEEMDSHFEASQEDNQNTNQHLEELQLRVPWPRLAGLGIQVGTSDELEENTTEASGRRIIPFEHQLLLPSQPPRLLPQSPMMPQSSMFQPPSQPPPPQHY